MDKLNALFGEYNNLWQEKIIHKQSIRNFHYYLTYLSTIGSLALTFIGLSLADLFKETTDKSKFITADLASLILIPLLPIIIIILSFAINDLFHIYAIGTQIGIIENKINKLIGIDSFLTWEHKICPFVYGGKIFKQNNESEYKIDNVIMLGDKRILVPFVSIICLASFIFGIISMYKNFNYKISCIGIHAYYISLPIYLAIIIYFFWNIIFIAKKLVKYVSYESDLTMVMKIMNKIYPDA